ncbi:MAG: hypothetical protein V4653_11330 [Pseudomonadota bacterium]
MTEPRPPADTVTPEPGTARALWPTFMRRTLPAEEVEDVVPEPSRPREHEGDTALKV